MHVSCRHDFGRNELNVDVALMHELTKNMNKKWKETNHWIRIYFRFYFLEKKTHPDISIETLKWLSKYCTQIGLVFCGFNKISFHLFDAIHQVAINWVYFSLFEVNSHICLHLAMERETLRFPLWMKALLWQNVTFYRRIQIENLVLWRILYFQFEKFIL